MVLHQDGDAAPDVLVVADAAVGPAVLAALGAAGEWRVASVADVDAALKLLDRQAFSCILLDLTVRSSSATSAVEVFRRVASTTGLVLLPGGSDRPGALVVEYAADDYVLPVEVSTRALKGAVDKAIDRARAARANAVLSSRLEALAAGSTDGLIVIAGNGLVESVSAVAERFIGAGAADVLGLALAAVPWSFVDRNDKAVSVPDCASLLALGARGVARAGHLGVRTADGAVTRVFLTATAAPGSDGVVVSLRDSGEHLAIQESARFQAALLAAISQAVVVTDPHGTVLFWNPAAEKLYGWTSAEAIGRDVLEVAPSPDPDTISRHMNSDVDKGRGWHGDYLLRRRDGSHFEALVAVAPVYDDRQDLVALIGVSSDITARKRAEEAARALSAIVESTADAVFTHDLVGTIMTWNGGAERLFGYHADQILGEKSSVLSVLGPERAAAAISAITEGHLMRGHETFGRRRDGTIFDVSVTASPIRDEDGQPVGVSVIARDISERQRMQQQLNHQATHDALTGLPNRTLLADRLQRALASGERRRMPVAVLFLDLDQFKAVNDVHGHLVGDELLVEVSQRLLTAIRPADTVARFGGDEFVIVCDNTGAEDAARVATRIEYALRPAFRVGNHRLQVSTSIGIAVTPPLESDPDVMLRSADAALYEAKSTGRARSKVFDVSLSRRSTDRLELTTDLREALENEGLQVHYQPVVDLQSGALVGIEALARWQHPARGWVPATLFVTLAEENGLSSLLDRWVLDRACSDAALLRGRGLLPASARVAVNVSATNVGDVDLVDWVRLATTRAGLPLDALELEVTESALLIDATRARQTLTALRHLGVTVALDDFGTGYSSLTNLRQLPVTTIKIDRSFIQHINERADDFAIVTSLVDLGRAVGLRTVAEGVETAEQLALLQRLGCAAGQGYFWSKAVPLDELRPCPGLLSDARVAGSWGLRANSGGG